MIKQKLDCGSAALHVTQLSKGRPVCPVVTGNTLTNKGRFGAPEVGLFEKTLSIHIFVMIRCAIRASESKFFTVPRSATLSVTSFFVACIIYVVIRKYLGTQVSRSPYLRLSSVDRRQTDVALGLKHGCLPPPQLPNQWPLGIDWIRRLWQSDSEQRLLAFLCSIADGYEPRNNLFQYLLFGPRAFHVLDPMNVEAVLSSQFQGMPDSYSHSQL